MPPYALRTPAHRAPRPSRRPRPLTSRRAAAVLGALAVLTTATGVTVAAAAPIEPAYPTVFISQTSGSTQLKQATQSRLANAGAGGVEIANVGPAAGISYNALAYRTEDSYAYAISSSGQLVRIEHDGSTTQLGLISLDSGGTLGAMYSGAFGEGADSDKYYVRPTNSGNVIYVVDVDDRTAQTLTLLDTITTNDFTAAYGFLWGVQADKTIVRIDPSTRAVLKIPAAEIFTSDDASQTSGYGAAWTYGNGNIAVSNNYTGNITQFAVTGAETASPTITKVSTIRGPSTSQNDGTTTPSTDVDLELTVASPAPAAPSAPITWTITVTNDGPGGSSGSVVSFPVPTGVTGVVPPVGCTVTSGVVQCVTGALPDGASDTFDFAATAPPAGAVSATSTVTIVGNELDPVPGGATLTITPLPTHLTSSGVATAPQSVTVTVPTGGSVTLLDADGDPATTVTVTGQGTYTLDGSTGVITFTPATGYTGTATPVDYRVTDAYGQSASSTYTPTVTAPALDAPDRTTTGPGPLPQSTTLPVPTDGSITLVGEGGASVTTLTVAGEGTYVLDPSTGAVTFTPVAGFVGTATPVTYRVVDVYTTAATGTYTPTVTLPVPPAAVPLTSSGPAVTPQQTTASVPPGGSITLLDEDGDPTTTVTIPGVGTYTLDAATGAIVFTPVFGFAGTPPTVDYRVSDMYAQSATGTYAPAVVPPAPPAAPAEATTGVGTTPHDAGVTVPTGGAVALLDADGNPATEVTVPGQGTYTLDPATGAIVFQPVLGFQGPGSVPVRVTDAYGQSTDGTYTPTVQAPPAPGAPRMSSGGAAATPQSPQTAVPVPTGGSIRLLDADGNPAVRVTVPGQGTYSIDPATGTLTFAPLPDFTGPATAVSYRVTDAYGQSTDGTYAAVVAAAPLPPLAATGGTPVGLALLAVGLLLGGGALVLAVRRRAAA